MTEQRLEHDKQFMAAMPGKSILNTVGTTYVF